MESSEPVTDEAAEYVSGKSIFAPMVTGGTDHLAKAASGSTS